MHMAHHDNLKDGYAHEDPQTCSYYYGCNYDGGYQTPPAWELYDLKKDPAELNNVYDDLAYAKTRERLKNELAALRKTVGDDGQPLSRRRKGCAGILGLRRRRPRKSPRRLPTTT